MTDKSGKATEDESGMTAIRACRASASKEDVAEYLNLMQSLGRQIESGSDQEALRLYHRLQANRDGWRQEYEAWLGKEIEIGAVAPAGDAHAGEIYGGIYPADKKPIWFLPAPKYMDHFNAASWASQQGGALPTSAQGDYLTTLKHKGGPFTDLFNRGGSFTGYVWLAEPVTDRSEFALCQRLSDGDQSSYFHRNYELPVLCVIR